MLGNFKSGSIRWQIVTLAVFPIVLVGILGIVTEPLFPEDTELSRAEVIAAKIDLVAEQVENAATPETAEVVLETTRRSGLDVRWTEPFVVEYEVRFPAEERLLFALSNIHGRTVRAAAQESGDPLIIVDLKGRLLAFAPEPMPAPSYFNNDLVSILFTVLIIALPVALLSIYAAQLITKPLIRIADAAQTPDLRGADFDETGPREIRQLARRLNEMRTQIHSMLKERTAMLRAVSHDLRTPLTRLKLRVERSVPAETAAVLMRDISAINDMIDETLNYLRSETEIEAARNADLPSLVRTICSDFSDIGFNVTYTGPDRLTFNCRSRALARAVSNLVDNATKHGEVIEIALMSFPDGAVRIEVSDDGPGLREDLRQKVLDPFVKGDPARSASSRSGFGLGLSIAQEVALRHGGTMELTNRVPNGLAVEITLPLGTGRNAPTTQRIAAD